MLISELCIVGHPEKLSHRIIKVFAPLIYVFLINDVLRLGSRSPFSE